MNTTVQIWCVWCGPVAIALYVLAFGPIAGYLPPHPPSMSPEAVAAFYETNRTGVRFGQLLGLILSAFLFPWFAVISVQMARIEGRFPVLSVVQFGGGTLLIVFFQICSMMWIIAAFRPELDATTVRVLHDGSWLIFVMVFPCYVLQMISMCIVGLMDKDPEP
ncbi:MAG: hypothetical protein ABW110_02875, partial [Steroidobacteraceae bacterium]